jgi:hypothetical protein
MPGLAKDLIRNLKMQGTTINGAPAVSETRSDAQQWKPALGSGFPLRRRRILHSRLAAKLLRVESGADIAEATA